MKPETRSAQGSSSLLPPNRLVGYAAKFNAPSAVMFDEDICEGPFIETIRPGAFANSLRDHPDVRALYDHQTSRLIARTKSGTMTLVEDEIGLHFDLVLPDTPTGLEVRALVDRGDLDGCSFGFFVLEDQVTPRDGLPSLRELIEVHCFEVTATAFPAYESTEIALRSTRRPASRRDAPPRPIAALAAARLRLALSRD